MTDPYFTPQTRPLGGVLSWWRRRYIRLEKRILKAIIEDPEIEDVTNVSAVVTEKGRERIIQLIGRLSSEKEKQRAQELAESNSSRRFRVINDIIVG
jgi:hypothetical protein